MRTAHLLWIAAVLLPSLAMAETAPHKLGAAATTPPVRHDVVADDRTNPERRVVDVAIDRRTSDADLLRIANRVLKGPVAADARAFVNFHIGGGKVRQAPWASVRIVGGKDPQVQILGLSLDEEARLVDEARSDKRRLVGVWLTASPLSPGKLTIYRDGSRSFAEWRLRNGSKTVAELVETGFQRGRRFDDKAGSEEHFVVTSAGDLEVRTSKELVATAERIALLAPAADQPLPTPLAATAKPRPFPRQETSAPRERPPVGRTTDRVFNRDN